MYGSEREREILRALEKSGYMSVKDLANQLYISQSSIRRDLTAMQKKGTVTRRYGGVELNDSATRNIPFSHRMKESHREKKKIAQAALELVKPGDVVMIDGSSTALYLFEELGKFKDITVITNGVYGIERMIPLDLRVISSGGELNHENRSVLVGSIAEDTIDSCYADIFFFATQAVSAEGDISDVYLSEISVRKHMLKRTKKSVFLCDSSKLGRRSSYRFSSLGEIDYMICDKEPKELEELFPKVNFITAK